MHGVIAYFSANAADLAVNLAFFLIVYLIARLLKAGVLASMVIATIPMLGIVWLLYPWLPPRLFSLLS